MKTYEQGDVWDDVCREVRLACDPRGVITWADVQAMRRLWVEAGQPFGVLAAPGLEAKAESLLSRGCAQLVRDSELALVVRGKVCTYAFSAKPDGRGGVLLLGTCLPEDHAVALQQVQHAMEEMAELNREIARQKRVLEQQKQKLEVAYQELDDSNKGVLALHAELFDKAETLQRTTDVKSRVVANVSHEFRTPLHTILGLSQLLIDAVDGPLSDEQRKQVSFIRTSAEELSVMVDDLLDLSKAESGKVQLRPEPFTVQSLFASLRGTMRPLLKADSPVGLIFDAPADEVKLETDPGKISQILRNLISNALKFTEQGEVRVTAQALPTAEGQTPQVAFTVSDTGIGIAPEHFGTVFDEFGQVENHLQRKVRGTGLGLPLARKLATLLGGTLTMRSELGEGSAFTLTVAAIHPEVHELDELKSRPLDPRKAPVLVVEDDRKTIFVYERYLTLAGFQTLPARTIAEAEEILKTVRPAAIVLDVMLEGETTWSFLGGLKSSEATRDIPVLVVTVTNKEQKARALGADEFWLKPVDQDRLLRKLKSLARIGTRTRVLVIDDDERARYLMRKLLADESLEYLEAGNGRDGLRLAREQRPHVIFLDFVLGDETAFDVLDELKADPSTRSIPVIVVTSHRLDQDERQRLASGTETILSKDCLSRELAINRIRDALRKATHAPHS